VIDLNLLNPAGILAKSNCFYIAAPIVDAPWNANKNVENAISDIIDGLKSWDINNYNLNKIEKILWYATVYGGLVLVYACDPIVPISRVHVDVGLSFISEENDKPKELNDLDLIKAWAEIFDGNEIEGLNMLAGGMVYPEKFSWRTGGKYKIAARGIKY
jgi:hypothetical protein